MSSPHPSLIPTLPPTPEPTVLPLGTFHPGPTASGTPAPAVDLLNSVSGSAGTFVATPVIKLILEVGFAYLVVCWLVTAYWAYRDAHDRAENLVLPFLAGALVLVATPFFFPFGALVWKIMRPAERLGDVYERNLAEEALLAEVESILTCDKCDKRVDPEWIICPFCRARLLRVCPNCEKLVGLDWQLCAWCGSDFKLPDDRVPAPWTDAQIRRLERLQAGPTPYVCETHIGMPMHIESSGLRCFWTGCEFRQDWALRHDLES